MQTQDPAQTAGTSPPPRRINKFRCDRCFRKSLSIPDKCRACERKLCGFCGKIAIDEKEWCVRCYDCDPQKSSTYWRKILHCHRCGRYDLPTKLDICYYCHETACTHCSKRVICPIDIGSKYPLSVGMCYRCSHTRQTEKKPSLPINYQHLLKNRPNADGTEPAP